MTTLEDRINWKNKIRQDYKGIVSEAQIEATIKYWEYVISSLRNEVIQECIDEIKKANWLADMYLNYIIPRLEKLKKKV